MNKVTSHANKAFWALVIGTVLILWLVEPRWVAHFSAIVYSTWLGTAIALYLGLNPKSDLLGTNGKIARLGSERTKQITQMVLRVLVLCFGGFGLYFSIALIADAASIATGGYGNLVSVEGRLAYDSWSDSTRSLPGVCRHAEIQERENGDRKSYMLWFCPRLREGATYKFMTAPNSEAVLDVIRLK